MIGRGRGGFVKIKVENRSPKRKSQPTLLYHILCHGRTFKDCQNVNRRQISSHAHSEYKNIEKEVREMASVS